jgi:hypothetical protein
MMMHHPRRALVGLFLLVACSESPEAKAPVAEVKQAEPEAADARPSKIHRAELEAVLEKGPPWILARVDMEEVLDAGKFVGWRIRELPHEWKGIDLESGDVVTAVNTMPLETPNDFWAAWTTLSVASELKVSYLRDNEAREMRLPIVGSPNPKLAKKLTDQPKGQPQRNQRKKTTVIRGEEQPLTDTVVDW